MPQENSNIREKNKSDVKEPDKYGVVFHNDDFTPMDFVTLVLVHLFFKTEDEALKLMLKVHHEGKATVGIYSYDLATTKAGKTIDLARKNGFPLRISVIKV